MTHAIGENRHKHILFRQIHGMSKKAIDATAVLYRRTALNVLKTKSVAIRMRGAVCKFDGFEGFFKGFLFHQFAAVQGLVPFEQIAHRRLNGTGGIWDSHAHDMCIDNAKRIVLIVCSGPVFYDFLVTAIKRIGHPQWFEKLGLNIIRVRFA